MKRKAKKKAELIAVTFKLTREDHQKLAALAEKRGISMAGQLRMWIRGEG